MPTASSPPPAAADAITPSLIGFNWLVSLLRLFGAIGGMLFIFASWGALDPSKRDAVLFVLATLSLMAGIDRARRAGDPGYVPSATLAFAHILASEVVLFACTGGVNSPFLIVIIPLSIMAGFLGGERQRAVPVLLVLIVWGFGLAEFSPEIASLLYEPSLSDRRTPLGLGVFCTLLSFILIAGNRIGMKARRLLDVTYQEMASIQEQRVTELAQSHRDLSLLTASIAHELKTPLTTLLSLGTYMQRRATERGDGEELDILVSQVRRMRDSIDALLTLSVSPRVLELSEVNLTEICRSAVRDHASMARERGVELQISGEAARLRGSARRLQELVENLLQNAIEASDRGGVVELTTRSRPADVILEVRDQGSGVDSIAQEALFSPGFTTKEGGNGIGLSVCRSIATQHGGQLSLAPSPTGGCEARLVLPKTPPPGGERG